MPKTTEMETAEFAPRLAQISALAQRLLPEIKRLFANEQIQKEFAEWQEKKNNGK